MSVVLSRKVMCHRLRALGVPAGEARQIVSSVECWFKASGEEWTVQRLKSLKTVLLQLAAGVKVVEWGWIAHSKGLPKGAFRGVFRRALYAGERRRDRALATAVNALMIYSVVKSKAITKKQWEKWQPSVETKADHDFTMASRWALDLVAANWKPFPDRSAGQPRPATIIDYSWSPSKRAPVTWDEKTVPETDLMRQIEGFFKHRENVRLYRDFFRLYRPALEPLLERGWTPPEEKILDQAGFGGVGKVSFIQEPGYKLRAVANPHRLHQVVLEPYKEFLWSLLRDIPQDFTFRQEEAFPIIQGWLWGDDREQVHSVDLSDATNHFPMEVSETALCHQTAWTDYEYLFRRLSRSAWWVTDPTWDPPLRRLITWKTGQPLGLGPSFGYFALGHHWLLQLLQVNNPGAYLMLGDDIVIKGEALHRAYRIALEHLRCPVSEPKCLNSDKLAEFAGRLITPRSVIPQYKWREPSDRSFIDLARILGVHSLNRELFPGRQLKVLRALRSIPTELGGLGFNPEGLAWDARIGREDVAMLISLLLDRKGTVRYQNVETLLAPLLIEQEEPISVAVSPHKVWEIKPWRSSRHSKFHVRDAVIRSNRIREEVVPVTDPAPVGLSPLEKDGDPRGKTTLERWEQILQDINLSVKDGPITDVADNTDDEPSFPDR